MAIYDCFQYFNEDHIVDLRLNILDKYVDFFIIVESKFFHNGKKRRLKFDINKFKKFEDKIIYIIQESEPEEIIKLDFEGNEHSISSLMQHTPNHLKDIYTSIIADGSIDYIGRVAGEIYKKKNQNMI